MIITIAELNVLDFSGEIEPMGCVDREKDLRSGSHDCGCLASLKSDGGGW